MGFVYFDDAKFQEVCHNKLYYKILGILVEILNFLDFSPTPST